MKPINIAVVGATGAVGEAVIELLEQRELPINELYLLASERTAGTSLMFRKKPVMVTELKKFDFSTVQLAIFVANDVVSNEILPLAQSKGCIVIDNSQAFADSAPLVVPSINGQVLAARPEVVVNPESGAILLSSVLKPFLEYAGIERVNVTSFHSVSTQGKKAIHELAAQTASLLNGRGVEKAVYPQQIAFNILPCVGNIESDGHTALENRLLTQVRRVLGESDLQFNVSCVQVPVFYADSMMLSVDTRSPMTLPEVHSLFKKTNEIKVLNDASKDSFATPVTHATGSETIFISRIRRDMSNETGINLWVVADNVRKSAAFNTVQIAEKLIKSYL